MRPQTLGDYIQQVLHSEYSSDHLDFEDDMKINKDSEPNTAEIAQKSLLESSDTVYSSHE